MHVALLINNVVYSTVYMYVCIYVHICMFSNMSIQGQTKITLLHIIKIWHGQKQTHDNLARNMFCIWNHTMFQAGSFEVFWEADINSKYKKISICEKLLF